MTTRRRFISGLLALPITKMLPFERLVRWMRPNAPAAVLTEVIVSRDGGFLVPAHLTKTVLEAMKSGDVIVGKPVSVTFAPTAAIRGVPKISITDTITGETREYRDEMPLLEHSEYLWSEGNYSCDCNRHLFFARAAGEDDPETECSDGRFRVRITADDGTILYEDDEPETAT